jgi:hypothetical protein
LWAAGHALGAQKRAPRRRRRTKTQAYSGAPATAQAVLEAQDEQVYGGFLMAMIEPALAAIRRRLEAERADSIELGTGRSSRMDALRSQATAQAPGRRRRLDLHPAVAACRDCALG